MGSFFDVSEKSCLIEQSLIEKPITLNIILREREKEGERHREIKLCKWLTGKRNDDSKINTGQATDKLYPRLSRGDN